MLSWAVVLFASVHLVGGSSTNNQCKSHAPTQGSNLLQTRSESTERSLFEWAPDDRRHLDRHVLELAASLSRTAPAPGSTEALAADLEASLRAAHAAEIEGHVEVKGPLSQQTSQYDAWAGSGAFSTICETGFNAGHSALRFLAGSSAKLFEFDLGEHNYSYTAKDFLSQRFPNRLNVEWGDSTKTLPTFRSANPETKCDLLIVDGGHDYSVAISDLKNFAAMAAAVHIVAIDDTPCQSFWCEGPTRAWQELKDHGCLVETCSVSMGTGRGFSTGRYIPSCSYLAQFA